MSRGRKTVPEGKGPAPQEETRTVDVSLMIEVFRDIEDMNSRFIETKKDLEELKDQLETTRERLDGLQQQLSHLALEEGEQGVKTG